VAQPATNRAIGNSASARYLRITQPSFGEARYFF
jgi:hypothetical protein